NEFHLPGREPWPESVRQIRFWNLDLFQNVRRARGGCVFDNTALLPWQRMPLATSATATRTPIPGFAACAGVPEDSWVDASHFPVIDVQTASGKQRHCLLMFSTSERAHEFVRHSGEASAFHVNHICYPALLGILKQCSGQVDYIAIDLLNNGELSF